MNKNNKSAKYSSIVIALTLFVCILGAVMGLRLPNALLPAIDRPVIDIYTGWPGKSAEEIEQTLATPLEKALYGLNNLVMMETNISRGSTNISLEFKGGSDMQQLYIEVMSRVNQVPGWPAEVARPFIQNNSDGANSTLATAMLYSTAAASNDQIIAAFKNLIEPALTKINGVANLATNFNPTTQRIDIEFDPQLLARYSLSLTQIMQTLNNLTDSSGDILTLGHTEYALHFKGQMDSEALTELPVARFQNQIVRLKDIATINKRLTRQWNFASINGHQAFYFQFQPTKGVNALEALAQIKDQISQLNDGPLASLQMKLELSRDDSRDIRNAINQVYSALLAGILLSSIILFYFLRQWQLVGLVFVSIPICLAMVLIAMKLFGYSLNVISLAGMALSVGLLLDAAIVVIENILRLKRQELNLAQAVAQGTNEVKSAIISSTISSIIIFVPIMLMSTSESQLFTDLAFTISSALLASLVVALVVLPVLVRKFIPLLTEGSPTQASTKWAHYLSFSARSRKYAIATIALCVPVALLATYLLIPSIDVLPDPKQRSVNTFISFSDPMSPAAVYKKVASPIFNRIQQQQGSNDAPPWDVSGMFCGSEYCLLYFYPKPGWDYPSFKQWISEHITQDLPGSQVFIHQGSLLRFALPNARNTQLDIQGDNLPGLQIAGKALLSELTSAFPEANIRATTALNNQAARVEFTPDHEQLLYYGMSTADLNNHLLALTQGVYLGRFYTRGDNYPFYLKGHTPANIDQLLNTQIVIPKFGLRPLSELVSAKFTLAPESILRVNRAATVSFSLIPPENMTVGDFSIAINQHIETLLQQPQFAHLHISTRGSSASLSDFLQQFLQMFAFSVLILMFLLWLSLGSWKLAAAVILSMPLAFAGGMVTLQLLCLVMPQNLDVITMIGFIILMGLVINNAILLASKYQQGINQGETQQTAILNAVESRKRPIYMSTGTSIFGMLPLMLSPGEGAEIYRGLAAVIIGGMSFSAIFSLSFMSALLSMGLYAPKQTAQRLDLVA